jgi:hypothetical protein
LKGYALVIETSLDGPRGGPTFLRGRPQAWLRHCHLVEVFNDKYIIITLGYKEVDLQGVYVSPLVKEGCYKYPYEIQKAKSIFTCKR